MPWVVLILSGALEAVWAAALHRTAQATGRRRIAPAGVFVAAVLGEPSGVQDSPGVVAVPKEVRRGAVSIRVFKTQR